VKLVADEGIDRHCIEALRSAGHDVLWFVEHAPGADDPTVLRAAAERQAVLLTLDKDFGHLVYTQGRSHCGVILMRLPDHEPKVRAAQLVAVLAKHGGNMFGAFTVIASSGVRIRQPGS